MTDDEISKVSRDAFTYGTGFMRDGKHVPLEDVYMTVEDVVTDDLVKRLREDAIDHRDVAGCCDCDPKDTRNWRHALNVEEAADRIEQIKELYLEYVDLAEERAARIKELEKALAHIYAWYPISVTQPHQTIHDIREFAKAALGEKKDG